ncbi:MAG: hypothetical protein IJ258_07200 [Methanobrevibacter sp.]|uniref:hypothetical protein n=1 Tax=Methanobrevibacter sp. TaxID=66852 RepID=UPI002600151B|nr:hypothetical protein [Methanobrevibacter sp.]MBQ8017879.1 hypothetical protein [Methanobrevibacter sp.]
MKVKSQKTTNCGKNCNTNDSCEISRVCTQCFSPSFFQSMIIDRAEKKKSYALFRQYVSEI